MPTHADISPSSLAAPASLSARVLASQELARPAISQSAPSESEALARLVARAQGGEGRAIEALLEQFRPLLRSRMHRLWGAAQEHLSGLEWADVESQVQLFFLTRLHHFQAERGVYFPHYITQLLDLDCRAWARQQRRDVAVPLSQLPLPALDEEADLDWWLSREANNLGDDSDMAHDVEQMLSLREALCGLTRAQQQVIWSCCVQGQTETQVALELGISRSAVRNRLAGGLTRLREFFHEHDEDNCVSNGTRTGRTSARSNTKPSLDVPHLRREFWDFWIGRMNMAKDEKRPDLVGVGAGRPILMQGVFEFEATGLKHPKLLSPKLSFTVPAGAVLGLRYFRAGVSCPKMTCFSTVVNGMPHRLIPVAADSTTHINLAIVEPIIAGSQIEIHVASEAPGTAIIDVGCLQMPA